MTPKNATQLAGAVWSAVDRKSLSEAVGHIETFVGREQGRWQEEIRELLIKLSGAPDDAIDGAGCDSGDPLDFTLTEISQGFTYIENQLYDAINAARPGFDWPEGKSAVDVAVDIIGGKYEEVGSAEAA